MVKKTLSPPEIKILILAREFLTELGKERAASLVALSSGLERDLGIDSLGRVELSNRIEKVFGVQLSQELIAQADTLQDLVNALAQAHPAPEKLRGDYIPQLKKLPINPSACKTLVEILNIYAKSVPERPHIYFQDEEGLEHPITYGDLLRESEAVAESLIKAGLKPEETVAIMLPSGDDFFYAFFGVLLAGGVPVPIYPPFRIDKIEEYTKREAHILNNAEIRILITFHQAERLSKLLKSFIPSLISVTTLKDLSGIASASDIPHIVLNQKKAAMIQYTSGSTGAPKGVLLTHENLLENIRAFGTALQIKPNDVVVSWLPLYHDMGLIGTWLGSLYFGIPLTLMSPLTFLTRPQRWLWAIHYHRATLSAAPNFAYELCARKIEDHQIEGLDLSSWRVALNGAEAINSKTLHRFKKRFSRYGFNPKALLPVYGLAENSVALTIPELGMGPKFDRVERKLFETKHIAVPPKNKETTTLKFVSCGKPLQHHAIRIVNEAGQALGERFVGEVQFAGPSAMQGYYRNPTATQAIYHHGWWATGDLGYIADEEIYIVGRKKDLIIKAGRNIYPDEIEGIVNQIKGIRKGCVITFGVPDTQKATEMLVIVAETQNAQQHDLITAKIMEKVSENLGIPPDQIILVLPRTLLKTSSGKLRRGATKEAYLKGELISHRVPAWLQLSKLFAESSWRRLKQGLNYSARLLYGGYLGILLLLTLPPTWLSVALLPSKMGKKSVRYFARTILALAACRLKIDNQFEAPTPTSTPKQFPIIYVVNHASYIDVMVLAATLSNDVLIVGKQELIKTPIIKTFMKRLNQLTVDRIDFTKSIEDTKKIINALKNGHSLVIFPEGTFTYATGLRPFKLGAFKIAAETGTPICPVALRGTRSVLRNGNLPRPGKIGITICPAIYPHSDEWQEVVRLANEARLEIAKHCGEYPIDLISAKLENAAGKPKGTSRSTSAGKANLNNPYSKIK